jgi:hypothetical protein
MSFPSLTPKRHELLPRFRPIGRTACRQLVRASFHSHLPILQVGLCGLCTYSRIQLHIVFGVAHTGQHKTLRFPMRIKAVFRIHADTSRQ